jgi:hypothetical protein
MAGGEMMSHTYHPAAPPFYQRLDRAWEKDTRRKVKILGLFAEPEGGVWKYWGSGKDGFTKTWYEWELVDSLP